MAESVQDRGHRGRLAVILVIVAVVVLAAALVLTQIDKWTCNPPGGVWVEASDECVQLP
jgi:hypothetical protein